MSLIATAHGKLQTGSVEAGNLLSHYHPHTPFFLSSPAGAMLTEGTRHLVSERAGPELGRRARELLARCAASDPLSLPILVGAVPFESQRPALLRIPERVLRAEACAGADRDVAPPQRAASEARVAPNPAPGVFARSVEQALQRIGANELRKVVLSRAFDVTQSTPIDVRALLRRLVAQNPGGFTFATDLPSTAAPKRVLVGSSPELLVARHGGRIVAQPLAGSVARSVDPAEDERRRHALLNSDKDLREHAIVVASIERALRPLCRMLRVPAHPTVIATPTLWHLSTRIVGTPLAPDFSSLDLALAMHPTPAVCGEPVDAARAAIRDLELVDRGFFTGAIGWCDAQGDGEWVVSIRCAEVAGCTARLFAGAGIVAGSRPEAEVAETGTKLRTMLRAFGLDHALAGC